MEVKNQASSFPCYIYSVFFDDEIPAVLLSASAGMEEAREGDDTRYKMQQ